ncbi:hypothetical protein QFZ27_001627 [Inquilinus ginsengisoli]|uniref:hypothetical protein n=1 Tax=Inquilinus ginsengisoli TaxID=363840 RepID=UPI003D1C2C61
MLALPIALYPAALFVFMALLHATMGDGFVFSHFQIGWRRSFVYPAAGSPTPSPIRTSAT